MIHFIILASCLVVSTLQSSVSKPSSSLRLAIRENFPDPTFIEVNGTYYAFATNNGKSNVPRAVSHDFLSWEPTAGDALPKIPAWSGGGVWAPDVVQLDDGSFLMYFAASSLQDQSKHCIGTATSKQVTGPYEPMDQPFACPLAQGGAIDPAGFRDADGSRWVVYKIDANSLGGGGMCGNGDFSHGTPIMLQQVSPNDGTTTVGNPQPILDHSYWDGPVIEAPSIFRTGDGTYFLFFSSNCYNGPYYDVSYATSISGVWGPYQKSTKPLLVTGYGDGQLRSPGGATVGPGGKKLVFHSDAKPSDASTRQMWTAELVRDKTTIEISGD